MSTEKARAYYEGRRARQKKLVIAHNISRRKSGPKLTDGLISVCCTSAMLEALEKEGRAMRVRLGVRVSKSDLVRTLLVEALRARGRTGLSA